MALDFPSSPVDQQVYGNFYYDASIGSWRNVGTKNGLSTRLTAEETLNANLNKAGLVPIIPTSVTVASGTASVASSGLVTFTTVGDFRVEGCFSSTYENYRVIINLNGSSSGAAYYLRLRNAGTTDTSANYYYSGIYTRPSVDTISAWRSQANTVWDIGRLYATATFSSASVIDISRPYLATRTHTFTQTSSDDGSGLIMVTHNGINANTTSSDSLAFHPSTGTMTGTIKIYGYRN